MRVLVTGAAGFIGFHLCRLLVARGHQVVGIDSSAIVSQGGAVHCTTMQIASACGNGHADDLLFEQCDGQDLAGQTCALLGLGSGVLQCDPTTCKFDTSQCGGVSEPSPEAGPEPQAESGPEAQPEPGPEPQTETQPEPATEAGPEPGQEVGPEPIAEAGPEPTHEAAPHETGSPEAAPDVAGDHAAEGSIADAAGDRADDGSSSSAPAVESGDDSSCSCRLGKREMSDQRGLLLIAAAALLARRRRR